jgi:hypothetical protein
MAWVYIKEIIRPRLEHKVRSIKQLIAQHEAKKNTHTKYTDEDREQFAHERFMQEADNQNTLYRT